MRCQLPNRTVGLALVRPDRGSHRSRRLRQTVALESEAWIQNGIWRAHKNLCVTDYLQDAWNLNEFYAGEDGGEALSDLAAERRSADADDEEGGEVAAARLLGLDHGHQHRWRRGQQRDAVPLDGAQRGAEVEALHEDGGLPHGHGPEHHHEPEHVEEGEGEQRHRGRGRLLAGLGGLLLDLLPVRPVRADRRDEVAVRDRDGLHPTRGARRVEHGRRVGLLHGHRRRRRRASGRRQPPVLVRPDDDAAEATRQLSGHLGGRERNDRPGERGHVRQLLGGGRRVRGRDGGADGHEREVQHGYVEAGRGDDERDVPGADAEGGPEAPREGADGGEEGGVGDGNAGGGVDERGAVGQRRGEGGEGVGGGGGREEVRWERGGGAQAVEGPRRGAEAAARVDPAGGRGLLGHRGERRSGLARLGLGLCGEGILRSAGRAAEAGEEGAAAVGDVYVDSPGPTGRSRCGGPGLAGLSCVPGLRAVYLDPPVSPSGLSPVRFLNVFSSTTKIVVVEPSALFK